METVTRETVELFNGGRAERKYTSETRDIVTPKSNRLVDEFTEFFSIRNKNCERVNRGGTMTIQV